MLQCYGADTVTNVRLPTTLARWEWQNTVILNICFSTKDQLSINILNSAEDQKISVAEPEPVEPKLFGTWSRNQSRN